MRSWVCILRALFLLTPKANVYSHQQILMIPLCLSPPRCLCNYGFTMFLLTVLILRACLYSYRWHDPFFVWTSKKITIGTGSSRELDYPIQLSVERTMCKIYWNYLKDYTANTWKPKTPYEVLGRGHTKSLGLHKNTNITSLFFIKKKKDKKKNHFYALK